MLQGHFFISKKLMRKVICIISIVFSMTTGFAQNQATVEQHGTLLPADWTKSERTEVYESGKALLAKYPTLTEEQRKSVALEYMRVITSKYTKTEWRAMLDVELEHVQSTTIASVAKNVGVELPVTRDEPKTGLRETSFSAASMEGTWTYEEGKYSFTEDGIYILEIGSKTCRGKWTLNGKILTTAPDGGMQKAFGVCTPERFDLMNPTAFEFSCVSGKKIFHFRKERR